ncbi:uncharacterized protein APUU_22018S [Aspergillus puulaauensis]|uniref:Zn(2)-C6 fungal-type domain-containing protein n=1 Tax=Aspergillus puulaauensis TaxID=1220207 RepID=A0A7R7XHK6_9EURO|nr:uncharacterized protein APUU_22018S [Aspergillus puulaauensis]BCS21586.1 hypothetical protein APUU_22018S [Aspergillus puulaauensis]
MTPRSSASSMGLTVGPLKSRRGCKTCKARKVKCGEEKPSCVRCTRGGRVCEYEGTKYGTFSSASSMAVIETPVPVVPNKATKERRAFAYYFQHAAPLIGGLDADFWSTIVPRVCHAEPPVWDAIIAISSLFESYKPCTPLVKYQDALGWYSRSVSAVRRRIEHGSVDVFVGLVSCVLFICIEALQGGAFEAIRLYGQGVQLILSLREQIASGALPAFKASLLEDAIVPIFSRLSILGNTQNNIEPGSFMRDADRILPPTFGSLKAAREPLFILTAEIKLFQEECEKHHDTTNAYHVPPEMILQQDALSEKLQNWYTSFTTLAEALRAKTALSPQETTSIALLLTHYESLVVILTTCVSRFKTTTDTCLQSFQTIVEQSRIALNASVRPDGTQPPFTFDISVGLPLWFTVLRCAEPVTRRAALHLLRSAPQVQGFYPNTFGLAFGENVMIVEEMFARILSTGRDPMSFPLTLPRATSPVAETPPDLNGANHTSLPSVSNEGSHSLSPVSTITGTCFHMPEEARIKPYGVFWPRAGILAPTKEEDVAKWNVSPDQAFLQFSRNRQDPETGAWRVVDECIPIDILL